MGWVFDGAQCSNLSVFGSILTKDHEARQLITPEFTGPKVKVNIEMKSHLKKSFNVLAGQ